MEAQSVIDEAIYFYANSLSTPRTYGYGDRLSEISGKLEGEMAYAFAIHFIENNRAAEAIGGEVSMVCSSQIS